ncbi:MAG: hypothetical protein IJ081_02250 [Prevotella sp.]|nr:hypothetical protein [Prevotella sp.]
MAISSNTLFHFTREFKYLKQSLEEGLWPRYCIEKKWNGKDLAIPMLCFCDIPLSQVKDHIDEEKGYGCYGIGICKSFARDNNITPVTYLSKGSIMRNKIEYYISNYTTPSDNLKRMDFEELMLYYVKKVNGYNKNSELKRKFYNEREWRYVPQISKDIHLEILTGDYDEKEKVEDLSIRTKNCKLILKPEDIAYIIVKEETEVKHMIKYLNRQYANYKLLEQLYSRIITVKQINEDF